MHVWLRDVDGACLEIGAELAPREEALAQRDWRGYLFGEVCDLERLRREEGL